jgi:ubiquinone/menaquinone biosynthesis C-methylase UbiE
LWWIIIPVILVAAIAFCLPRRKVQRDPSREKPDTIDSIHAYAGIANWLVFKTERRIMVNALSSYQSSGNLVDLGCGPAYLAALLTQKFPGLKVTGLDRSGEMLGIAKRNWNNGEYASLSFCNADAQVLPFRDDSIDCVISSLSLHHWANPRQAFREINRVLKPGGRLLIFDLRRDSRNYIYYVFMIGQMFAPLPLRKINGAVGSLWSAYTKEEMTGMSLGAGFESVQVKPQLGWMLVSGEKKAIS